MGIFKKEEAITYRETYKLGSSAKYPLGGGRLLFKIKEDYYLLGIRLFTIKYGVCLDNRLMYRPLEPLETIRKDTAGLFSLRKGELYYGLVGRIQTVVNYKSGYWKIKGRVLHIYKELSVRSIDSLESILLKGVRKGAFTKADIEGLLQ